MKEQMFELVIILKIDREVASYEARRKKLNNGNIRKRLEMREKVLPRFKK